MEIVFVCLEVEYVLGMGGFSFLGNDSSKFFFFVKLKNWDECFG